MSKFFLTKLFLIQDIFDLKFLFYPKHFLSQNCFCTQFILPIFFYTIFFDPTKELAHLVNFGLFCPQQQAFIFSQVFLQYVISVLPVFRHCFASVWSEFSQCFTSVSAVFHQSFTSVSPVFHQSFTSISPVFTSVSPVFQQSFTRVLSVFYQYFISVSSVFASVSAVLPVFRH